MKWTGNQGGSYGWILLFDLLHQRDFVLQRAQWLTPVSIAIKHKGDGLCYWLVTQSQEEGGFDGRNPLDTVKQLSQRPPCKNSDGTTFYPHMISLGSCSIKANADAANLWSQTVLHFSSQVCVSLRTWQIERCRDRREAKGSQNISTSRNEPRAMNPINSVMWALMLFMLRVGVWIIEIRATAKCGGTSNCKWPVI